jgi:hypothetical protein
MSEEELIVNAGRESVEHAIKAVSALDPSAPSGCSVPRCAAG